MDTTYKVTRRALLILCPGKGRSFLPGTKQDGKNVKAYLTSEKGGAWYDDEIETLVSPTLDVLAAAIQRATADYSFIYFSGHGFTTDRNNRMICIQGHDVEDTYLLNKSQRQLISVDACRNFSKSGLSGVPDFGEHVDHFVGKSVARELFDQFIINSLPGKLIVHATQAGEYSYDSPQGGMFTLALLNVATRLKVTDTYSYSFIDHLLPQVHSVLQSNGNSQIPTVAYRQGNLTVPFALGLPWLGKSENLKRTKEITANELLGWGIAASVVVLLVAFASGK